MSFCDRNGRNCGRFRRCQTAETPWIPQQSRSRDAGSAGIFFWVWRIAWDLQCFRRNVQNDAATIALGFLPKVQLGLRMRPSVIIAVTCNDQ
jgi:hypothetical protein